MVVIMKIARRKQLSKMRKILSDNTIKKNYLREKVMSILT